jgi:hypothetical protein
MLILGRKQVVPEIIDHDVAAQGAYIKLVWVLADTHASWEAAVAAKELKMT